MEFLLFLLYPAGVVGIVGTLFMYLRSQETGQRAIKAAKAHLTPAEDIEAGYKAVEASVKRLRQAKNEEQALLASQWEQQFYTPEEYKELQDKRRHDKMLSDHKIQTRFIPVEKTKMISSQGYVDDGPEWKPLGDSGKDPDTELSYSQRQVQSAGAFIRKEPHTSAAVYGTAVGGSVMRFDGYVRGQSVAGNDVWFVYIGENSGLPKFVHSIATTNRSTSGLRDLTEYDTETIMNGAGEICAVIKTRPTGGVVMGSDYLQLPNATIRSRQAENLNPDQVRELERQPAIVNNYQDDRRKEADRLNRTLETRRVKYDPVPKEFRPVRVKEKRF